MALFRARTTVETLKFKTPNIQANIHILLEALKAPIRQIAENAGVEGSIVVGKVLENSSPTGPPKRSIGQPFRCPSSSKR